MKLSVLFLVLLAMSVSHALDPMYSYRYTLGPEILVPDAFHVGIGAWTYRKNDLNPNLNFQLGITDKLEIGMKHIVEIKKAPPTPEEWKTSYLIDVGAKYAITPHVAIQADIPVAINKDREWGGVFSLSSWSAYTKNISFISEGRLGIGNGATGGNSYVKPSLAFVPYFQIGESFRVSVGTIGSCSFENFEDDFMLDILPRVEIGFVGVRAMGEVSIGILTWAAEKDNRYALYTVFDL